MSLRATLHLLAALVLSTAGPPARAADSDDPGLPPSLTSAVTLRNEQYTLRVIVFSVGFEHVSSRVYLQWVVADRDSPLGSRLVNSVLVREISGGLLSVGEPRVKRLGAGFRVVLEAVDRNSLKREELVLVTEQPGAYRLSQ